MYINLFNWLVKIRTIKVSVLYDMHERSNSTFWEIYIRWQRDIVKVRIFEKVKKCCSLDSHPNRNWNYETPQTDWDSSGQCTILPSLVEAPWGKGETSSEAPDWLETLDPAKLCFPALLGSGAGLGIIHIHVCKIRALLRVKQQSEKAIN